MALDKDQSDCIVHATSEACEANPQHCAYQSQYWFHDSPAGYASNPSECAQPVEIEPTGCRLTIQVTYLKEWTVELPPGLTDDQRDHILATLADSMAARADLPLQWCATDVQDESGETVYDQG